MKYVKTCAVALAALAMTATAATAQESKTSPDSMSTSGATMPGGNMNSGAMNNSDMRPAPVPMSRMDTRTMKSCQAMDHDAMMKAMKCQKLMAGHPDVFNDDGSMKTEAAHN